MAYIKNEQLGVLIKMENLIGGNEKVLFGEDKQGVFKYDERVYHKDGTNEIVERTVSVEDFNDFMNVIEDLIKAKKEDSKKVVEHRNPERHREYNREWAKKDVNRARIRAYQKQYYEKVTKVKRKLEKKGL